MNRSTFFIDFFLRSSLIRRPCLLQFVPECTKDLVPGHSTVTVVALKEPASMGGPAQCAPVVEVVVLVGLHGVLPATVASRRGEEDVDAHPGEDEGGGVEQEGGGEAGEVVEVLHRMHRQAGEGLNVCVPVVDRMDVLEEGADVEEAVAEVEMEPSEDRDPKDGEDGEGEVPWAGGDLLVCKEG